MMHISVYILDYEWDEVSSGFYIIKLKKYIFN